MYKVLIVDDETIVKIALRSIIDWEKQGFTICGVASNGQEALELIVRQKPHLVITDIKMPVMDGIELIRQISEIGADNEVVVLSNYDDFESVRSALLLGASDYLLKVKLEEKTLLKILEKVKEKLNHQKHRGDGEGDVLLTEQKLLEVFFSTDQTPESLAAELNGISRINVEDKLSLCVVSFTSTQGGNKEQEEHNATVIKNTLLDAIQSFCHYKLLTIGQTDYVILHEDQQEELEQSTFLQILSKISKRFGVYTSIKTSLYYHYGVRDFAEAKKAFLRGMELKEFDFYGHQEMLDIRTFKPLHYLNYVNYKEVGKALYENKDKSPEINSEVIAKIVGKSQEKCIYPEILKLFFIKVLDYLVYLMEDVPVEVHDYISDTKDDIRICGNKEDLLKFLKQSLAVIFNPQILDDKKATYYYKPEVEQAINFIQQNYTKKISLDVISCEVNLSTGYLCRSFKSQVGMTITNYINKLRLEHARELLQKRECMVKEAALQVGFDDPLYFSRLFKKHYKVSPSEINK